VEKIETFLKALEKEGLYKGRILYKGRKYIAPLGRGLKKLYIYGYMLAIVLTIVFIAIPYIKEIKANAQIEREYNQYISLAINQLKEDRFESAGISARKAKEMKDTPRVNKLLKDIEDKKEARYQALVKLSEKHLKSKNLQASLKDAVAAKNIKDTQEIRQLINDINDIKRGKKINDEYRRLLNLAKNQLKAENFQAALDKAKKAKKIKNSKEILQLIEKIEKRITTNDEYRSLLNSAQNQLKAVNFKAALEDAEKAKKIKNTGEVRQLIKRINDEEDKIFNLHFNLINGEYRQGDFKTAREYFARAGKIKFNDKIKEEKLKKIGDKINPIKITIDSKDFPSMKSITFDPVESNELKIVRVSKEIPYTEIENVSNLNRLKDEIIKNFGDEGITISPLKAEYFKREQIANFWVKIIDSGKWQFCTGDKDMTVFLLLKKTGSIFEIVKEMTDSYAEFDEIKENIFIILILKKEE
jgi:hypothetical protein